TVFGQVQAPAVAVVDMKADVGLAVRQFGVKAELKLSGRRFVGLDMESVVGVDFTSAGDRPRGAAEFPAGVILAVEKLGPGRLGGRQLLYFDLADVQDRAGARPVGIESDAAA